MRCPTCDTEMKSLFTSTYCPNEDRHEGPQQDSAAASFGGDYVLAAVTTTVLIWDPDLQTLTYGASD